MKTIKEWMKKFKDWNFYVEDWDRGCADRCEIEGRLKQVQEDAFKAGYNEGFNSATKLMDGK